MPDYLFERGWRHYCTQGHTWDQVAPPVPAAQAGDALTYLDEPCPYCGGEDLGGRYGVPFTRPCSLA